MTTDELLLLIPGEITIQNIHYKLQVTKSNTSYFVCYKALFFNAYLFYSESINLETALNFLHKELLQNQIIQPKED
jgi:hypothetical protein